LTKAVKSLVEAPLERERMGESARSFVESWASPAAVAKAYEELFHELRSHESDGGSVLHT
jgi:colanic acid biosynthesis glycosyl transferase WcaI